MKHWMFVFSLSSAKRSKTKKIMLSGVLIAMVMAIFPVEAEVNSVVRLQLKWEHQFQFAGYYAAIEQGYYEEAGIQVELIPASPEREPLTEVLQGRAEFGVGNSELLLHFYQGDPVVVLAVIFQHSPLILLSRTENPLQTLHDLDGQRVAIEPGTAELFAYLKREGVNPTQFDVVQHAYHLQPLIDGELAAQSAYSTTETFELESRRIGYQIYSPRSVGIDFYGDNLFTTQTMLDEEPDLVENFRNASLRGWFYAMDHPEEIIELILEKYPTSRSREALHYEAEKMHQLMRTDLIEPGHMITGRWQHMANVYSEIGMLPEAFSLEGFLYQSEPEQIDLQAIYVKLFIASALAAIFAFLTSTLVHFNKRLRKSEQKLRVLFDTAPLAYIVLDQRGYIKEWNNAASRIFNWPRDEIIGRNTFDTIVNADDSAAVKQVFERTVNEHNPVTFMNSNLTRDGTEITCEWVNTTFNDNSNDDEVWILSIASDVTERAAIEKALKQARDQAQEALSEHKQLISMLSHELRSPLATIASANAVIKAAIGQGDFKNTALMNTRINSAIQRLRRFLDNLTADDRLSTANLSNQRANIDVQRVVQKSVTALQDQYPHRYININMTGPREIIGPDSVLLDVVITNLLDNAMKYSVPNTAVSISIESAVDNSLCLEVHNFGPAIPEKLHEEIFHKYYRAELEQASGTGLGLYLVKRIAISYNASIQVTSSDEEGTMFRVIFPSVEPSEANRNE